MTAFSGMLAALAGGSDEAESTTRAFEDVLESLSWFSMAPAVARRCVYAVVLNTKAADLEEFRPAFLHSDKDGDGLVSRKDLGVTLQWASALSIVDPDLFFAAADVDNSGFLDFKKFAAACLYGRLAPMDDWLAEQAFKSLDADHDGALSAADVVKIFGFLPAGLPSQRFFCIMEWTQCILLTCAASEARSASKQKVGQAQAKLVEKGAGKGQNASCVGIDTMGLFAGCAATKNKFSHKRQGTDDNEGVDFSLSTYNNDVLSSYSGLGANRYSSCSQQYAMTQSLYAPGSGLSSPPYVPRY